MKLLLFVPLNESFDELVSARKKDWKVPLNAQGTLKRISCCYPGGLLSIGSYLKKHLPDVDVTILDCNVVMNRLAETRTQGFEGYTRKDFYADAFSFLPDFQPDLIGVSFLFCDNYQEIRPLTEGLKARYPGRMIIAGGHLVTAIYEQVFSEGMAVDAIAYGEGEVPVLELCRAMTEGRAPEYLAASASWITPEKAARTGFKPEGVMITDLDEIPRYELDMLVHPDAYYHSSENLFTVAPPEVCQEMYIFTTRGCPYHCLFCASQNVHGHKVRTHSVERIQSDILHFHKNFGITRFNFSDDHFFWNKERAIGLLNFVHESGLQVDVMGAAFFKVDAEVAATLRKVGISQLNITMESGNEDTLARIIRKPAKLKHAEAAIEFLHREGITVISNVLIGFPGETKEAIDKGLNYLKGTNVDWFLCLIASPLPGSDLYQICRDQGYLTEDYFSMSMRTTGKAVIRTPEFSPEYIEKKVYEMNLTLNFVNNYGMRTGDYQNALRLFERVLSTAINTHAFAYYFAAKCCEKLALPDKYTQYKAKYREMIERYPFWKEWADYFKLQPLA